MQDTNFWELCKLVLPAGIMPDRYLQGSGISQGAHQVQTSVYKNKIKKITLKYHAAMLP